jgi:electron transfer flavoprotein beta subunit
MWTTAAALAAAVKAEGAELVITGKQSVDDNSGAVYAGVAARLGWPLVSAVTKVVEIAGGRITVERMVEGAQETVSVPCPPSSASAKRSTSRATPVSWAFARRARPTSRPRRPPAWALPPAAARRNGPTSASQKNARRNVVMIDGASVEEKAAKLADALMAEKVI